MKLRWSRAVARATYPPTRGVQAGGVAELHLLETHDKMDEMVEWMVPMSTGQVEPHIAGRFISMQICSASAEVQLVLISISLVSIL